MKKLILLGIAFLGLQSSVMAQDTTVTDTDDSKPDFTLYFAVGATFSGDYNINKNLDASGMPLIDKVLPEITFGYSVEGRQYLIDFEISASYMDKKNSENRLKTAVAGVKLRGHYIPVKTKSFFVSGGVDLSYATNQFDLWRRDRVIDMNDLNPSDYSGHISLTNEQVFAGPSVAIGLFQDKGFPIRLNAGYDFAITNGKWKTDFGNVENAVKENGFGRFYTKLTFLLK